MNTRPRLLPRRNPTILASTVAALIASCLPAHAANKTWDGAGADDNWLTGANWDLDTAPTSNDALFFAGVTRVTPSNNFAAGSLFNGITFNAGADPFTLSGNAITLSPGIAAGGGTVTGGNVTNNSTNAQTVNVPLTLAAGNHTFVTAAGSGTLSLAGAITRQVNATAVFTRNGGQINLTGSGITNTNGILGGWAVIGNDWAALDGGGNVAAYTGYTPISTGALASDPTFNYRYIGDSGNLTAATGTTINSLVTTVTAARSLTITGTMKLGPNGGIYRTGASTGNSVMTVTGGTLTANGGGDITLACATNSAANFAATNNNLTIASVIANDGANAVSVNVLGYVVMSAANTFTGGTFINQGRVQASNAAAFGNGGIVTVFPGAEAFLNNNGTYANPFVINGIGATEASGGQQLGAIRMNTGGTNISGQITLATNSRISGGSGGNNIISGRITGPGRLEFTAATGNNGSITLSNPANDWNGGLLVTVGGGSRQVYLRLGASEVIPDGAGKGDMTIAGTSDIARLDLNGFSETINGLNSAASTNNQITNLGAGTPVLTVGNNNAGGSFGGVISGSMGLTKIGSGTQTLSGANTYTGDTNVNAGALIVTDSLAGAVNVNTSASGAGTLGGTGSLGGVTLAAATGANVGRIAPGATTALGDIGTLTLGSLAVNGGNFAIDFAGTNDLVSVVGAANFAAASTISPGGNPTAGTYTILTAGTLTLTVPPTIITPSGTRKTFTPDFSVANTIRITVGDASKTLNWTGAVNGVWDVNTTGNWHDGAVAETFFNGDTVNLLDGPANRTLTLTGITVTPAAVNVNNSAGDYTITGTGSIGGTATLTKTGPGPLTIANPNSYTGGTTLAAGTINVNNATALGTGLITITGGMLNNTSGAPITMTANNAQQWNGDFTFVGSNNLNMGAGAVALGADRTVTVAAGNLTVGGVVSGAFNLTKAGPGTLTLGGASTYEGVTNVNEGTVVVTNAAADASSLGSLGGGAVNVVPGAAVDFAGSATANALNFGAKIFNIAGTGVGGTGALTHSGTTGQNNALQQVTLTADATVGGTGRFDIRGGGATLDLATHTLTKTGSNQFTLVGTNVTDGNIVVNQGVFAMETFTSFADFSSGTSITYNAGTTAQFFNLSGVITRPMIFNGGVTVGNASAQASTISSPMTLNGDLTFTNLNASTGALNVLGDLNEIGGARSITKNGPTTLVLGGIATLSGTTTVNAGTLSVSGTLAGSGAVQVNGGTLSIPGSLATTGVVNVNAGGTLSVTGSHLAAGTLNVNSGGTLTGDGPGGVGNVTMAAGSSFRPGATGADDSIGLVTLNSLTVNGGDMRFNLVEPGTSDAVTVTNGVTYTAASTLTPTGLTNGTYTLLTAGSAINYGAGGVNTPTLNLPPVDPLTRPKTYTLDTTSNTSQLKLTLAGGVKTITWTGITDGDWKINDNTRNNWKDAVNAPDVFYNNDTVQFSDGPLNRNVAIPAALAPAAIVVNNSVGNDYVFTGAAIGGAATLTKSGTGALTLATANTFTGGTTLAGGALNINHATALGTGPIIITGGTIDNTSGAPVVMTSTNAQQWNGDFTFTGSNNLSFGAGAITLDADRIVTIAAAELTVPGVISGFSALTKAGAGKLRLTGVNTYGAPTTISAGTVVVSNAGGGNSSLGSIGGGPVTIAAGGTVDLSGSATAQALNFGAKQFYIAGTGADGTGAIINNGVSQFNALQQVFLTADATVGGGQRFDIRSAPTSALNSTLDLATFTLTKSGTNQFSLVGTNVTDGDIIVNGGTFSVETVTSIPDFASGKKITLNAGTTLQFFSNTAVVSAVTRPILVNGAVTMGSASNGNNSTIGSPITLSGNLTVAALNNTNATSSVTLTGNIGETVPHSLTKNGPSTLVLAGTNSYSGGTFINAGVLRVTADAGLGAAAGGVTIDNGATLQAAGSFTSNRPVTLGLGGGTIDTNGNDVTLGAGSSVTGAALTKAGLGKLTIAGAQTYGTLTTAAGITQIDSALGTGTSTLNANATTTISVSQTLAALNIGAGAVVTIGAAPSPQELAFLLSGADPQPGDSAASPAPFEASDPAFASTAGIGGEASGLAASVPEPGSLIALLSGAGTFLGLSRFRRRPAPRLC